MGDAPAGAAALSPPPVGGAVATRVLVDVHVRAHSPNSSGRSSRAAALDPATLAALDALDSPAPWSLLLIVGPSGSGKSLALAQLRQRFNLLPSLAQDLQFQRDRATVSHDGFSCPPTAVKRLSLCGARALALSCCDIGACEQQSPTRRRRGNIGRYACAIALQGSTRRPPGCSLFTRCPTASSSACGAPILRHPQAHALTRCSCSLALSLWYNATVEDLGTGVDSRVACSVASSAGRFVRTKELQHVVITTSHPELIPWLNPDIVLFMPSGSVCVNPLAPARRRPVVALRYDSTRYDSGALPPGVEYAVRSAKPRVTLTCSVRLDDYTTYASRVFDVPFSGTCTVQLTAAPTVPPVDTWSIGLLYGPSGCGKSTHLSDCCKLGRSGAAWAAARRVYRAAGYIATVAAE